MRRGENSGDVDRAAARWAVRLDRGLSAREGAALEAWMAGDPRRAGALARAMAILAGPDARAAPTPSAEEPSPTRRPG